MKVYIAGGEGLTNIRQKDLFKQGCKNRLVSFFGGESSFNRVINAAKEWEKEKKNDT